MWTVTRRAVGRHRGSETALAVAERSEPGQLGTGLGQQVLAGDPEVSNPVADELDDVVGSDEEDVEIEIADPRDEASLVLLEDEAGVAEELDRRLDQAALVRDREAQALATLQGGHPSRPAG